MVRELLKAGLDIRNGITHPRTPCKVTEKEVTDSLNAVLEAIDVLFQSVYGKPYPGKGNNSILSSSSECNQRRPPTMPIMVMTPSFLEAAEPESRRMWLKG